MRNASRRPESNRLRDLGMRFGLYGIRGFTEYQFHEWPPMMFHRRMFCDRASRGRARAKGTVLPDAPLRFFMEASVEI